MLHTRRARRHRLHPLVGTVRKFHETVVEGSFDTHEVMRTLQELRYEGVPDHVPPGGYQTDWRHRTRGDTTGYLRSTIHALEE